MNDRAGANVGQAERTTGFRDHESPFRHAFEHVPTGICLTTLDGSLLAANHAACEMLGYPENELTTLDHASVIPPADMALQVEC